MSPGELMLSVAILGGVATVFGAFISLANVKFKVWEDPRVDGVRDLLPGADCGACGEAGCRAFAEAVVNGKQAPAQCTVMGADARADVAAYLGVDAGKADKRVARLLCAGGRDVAPYKGRYHGVESCAAADPAWLPALRRYRLRPSWPGALPDDADYGPATHLCLPPAMVEGEGAKKLAAIGAYASQLGFAARSGSLPQHLGGLMDCNGYLIAFARSTEAFVLTLPDRESVR